MSNIYHSQNKSVCGGGVGLLLAVGYDCHIFKDFIFTEWRVHCAAKKPIESSYADLVSRF